MNWPPLHTETSEVLALVLKDVVTTRPRDLFECTAQLLQEKSGLNPTAFQEHFDECKRKPRVYELEERSGLVLWLVCFVLVVFFL